MIFSTRITQFKKNVCISKPTKFFADYSFIPLQKMMRPTADFSPSVWGNYFISSPQNLKNGGSNSQNHLQNMMEKVRSMLLSYAEKPSQKLKTIDTIQRLGVSYHFESEIEEILQNMQENPLYYIDEDADDLCTIALWFRLLRQQGYNISCDIFKKFRDDKGDFKAALIHDVLGMLSLYEAANLRFHGEHVLDQALAFTTIYLQSSLDDMDPNLKEKVTHALNCPFRKGLPRLEARYYISMYSREVSQDDLLLEFVIIDFNVVQAQHREELSHVTEWWQKLEFVTKVPYARDRIVEAYFWQLGVYFEPQYKIGREIVVKLTALISALDDTYDAYATLKELEPFTEAIQRWDISPIDSLSECMKVVFKAFLDLFDEMELLSAEVGTSSFVQFIKQEVQKLAQAYLVEARWRDRGYVPTCDEYMKNGITSSACPVLTAASFLGLEDIVTREVFDWFCNDDLPKIARASAIIGRLTNDRGSYKFEMEREHVATAVECCMNQHGISEEEAVKLLNKDIENGWKDINEEFLKPNRIPLPVLECALNSSRMCEFWYVNSEDKYTHGELMKDYIAALLVNPIQIEQNE